MNFKTVKLSSMRHSFAFLLWVLTFAVIVASGGLLLLIEKGMRNSMDKPPPSPRGNSQRSEYNAHVEQYGPVVDTDFQIRQEIRNRTIQTMCGQESMPHDVWSLSPPQRETLLNRILVNDKHRFLYCFVPKVACTNWKRVLLVLSGAMKNVDITIKMDYEGNLPFLSKLNPEEIRYRLKHYFKFMFVREPMARLLSAYNNKFSKEPFQKMYGVEIMKRYREGQGAKGPAVKAKGDNVTFTEFVRYLVDEDVDTMNAHWMPAYNLCQPCAVSYDFIGSHEHQQHDAEYVLRHVGAPDHVHFPTRQPGHKTATTETLHYYLCGLPQELLKALLPKYIMDFSLFTYPLPNTTTAHCRD